MTLTLDVDDTILKDFRPRYDIRLVSHCAQEFNWTPSFSRKIVRDALRFLSLCATPPTGNEDNTTAHVMVSSPTVDKVVDIIMLDTPLLMWLERIVFNGVRLVHVPTYAHGVTDAAINNARYAFTVSLMQAAGYDTDKDIWPDRLPDGYLPCRGTGNDDCFMYALPKE